MNPLTPLTPLSNTNVANSTPAVIIPTPPVMQTPTTSGAVLTSNTPRENVTAANNYLSNVNTAATNERIASQQQTAAVPPAAPVPKGKTTTDIYNTVSSIGADLSDAKLSRKASEGLTSAEKSQALYKAQIKKVTKELTNLQKNMDARTSETIAGIGREYDALVQEQEAANYQYESGVTTAGFRSGLNQYASQIQGNILHNAMSEGIKKISNIQIARAKLINEAEAARDERNYKMLTAKMDMLRQNYKDEQDAVYRMQDEIRKVKDDTRKDTTYKTESVAPQLARTLTGNQEQDMLTYQQVADNMGVPVSSLVQAVDAYKRTTMKDAPQTLQEYQSMVNLGYINPNNISYNEYVETRGAKGKTLPKGSLISVQEANAAGIPELSGISEDELAKAMVDSKGNITETAPTWFNTLVKNQLGTEPTAEIVQGAWTNFKDKPAVQKFVYGAKSDSGVDFSKFQANIVE